MTANTRKFVLETWFGRIDQICIVSETIMLLFCCLAEDNHQKVKRKKLIAVGCLDFFPGVFQENITSSRKKRDYLSLRT